MGLSLGLTPGGVNRGVLGGVVVDFAVEPRQDADHAGNRRIGQFVMDLSRLPPAADQTAPAQQRQMLRQCRGADADTPLELAHGALAEPEFAQHHQPSLIGHGLEQFGGFCGAEIRLYNIHTC